MAPGEGTRTITVLCPSPTLRLLSQGTETSNEKTLGNQNLFKKGIKQATWKVRLCL